MLKTILAGIAAVLAAVLPALPVFGGLSSLGPVGIANVVILVCGAAGVWLAANLPTFKFAKLAVAGVAAGGVVFMSAYSDAFVSLPEWVQIVLAVLGAAGVGAVRNSGTVDGVIVQGKYALPSPPPRPVA
jgi:hypothetical protein